MQDHTSQYQSSVAVDDSIFQPNPSEIIIDEYEPFGIHQVKLALRNRDTVSRRVKIEPPDSPFFSISAPRSTSKNVALQDGRVAAGMEICFILTFKPQERKDYFLDLVCCTERENFIVPVKVKGTFASLSFPELIDFKVCPVKAVNHKAISVHNKGTIASKFVFSTTDNFKILPRTAFVGVNQALQLDLEFTPTEIKSYDGLIRIENENGAVKNCRLLGEGKNIEIFLSQPMVELDPAYISLTSQAVVKIKNASDFPVKFQWKAFQNTSQEEEERIRLNDELTDLQNEEITEYNIDLEEPVNESAAEDDQTVLSKRDQVAILKRKYNNLRRAVQDDPMQFVDDCFRLDPPSGEIWSNSEMEIHITFSPDTAATYNCSSFLDVTGRDARLPLQLLGKGIGPKAALSYEMLDIGNSIYVNSVHKYLLQIENQGEIRAEYQIVKKEKHSESLFQCEPSHGILDVGEKHDFEVTFSSDTLGPVAESIQFKLQGALELLKVQFKGHVIGPTFCFDTEKIDFGQVSYGFENIEHVTLINASEIPMKYSLRVPPDKLQVQQEFEIFPSRGLIPPNQKQEIKVIFTSFSVKKYEKALIVDIDNVGTNLFELPIVAESKVASVSIANKSLEYGECFLRYEYFETVELVNSTPGIGAKFEFIPQDEYSSVVAKYSAATSSGSLDPESSTNIAVSLCCEKAGNVRLPVYIRIAGAEGSPLSAIIMACGKGPCVILRSDVVDWGNISCLRNHVKPFEIVNDSTIPANIKTFIKSARSKFSVDVKETIIPPNQTLELQLTANLDDTVSFTEQMHILVTEGKNMMVPLSAHGIGTTMWCETDLGVVDFEHQFTNRECEWKCTLENKGRRSQLLTWTNMELKQKEIEALQTEKDLRLSKKGKAAGQADSLVAPAFVPVFWVHPTSIELKPRTACTFTFFGFSANAGPAAEKLVCESKIGQEKKNKTAFSTTVQATFINPMLEPSSPKLCFSHVYSPDAEIVSQYQPLTLKNVTQLPLTFVLRTTVPFSLDTWECTLDPGKSIELQVEFDPSFKDDKESVTIHKKLTAVFQNHPQKDAFDLFGEISFPNLEFSKKDINFGVLFNGMQKSIVIQVTNTSKVITAFHWTFIEEEQDSRSSTSSKKANISINQVFDVLPIRSQLQPGESEDVEFIYYAQAQRKFSGHIVCNVEGGPEYMLTLHGEASGVAYKIDRNYIDFGSVLFDKYEDREFVILNTGKVPVSFKINTRKVKRLNTLAVSPMHGTIAANDKHKIIIKWKPGIPEALVELLMIEVDPFQPFEFKIYCQGIYASVGANLPRENTPCTFIDGTPPSWSSLLRLGKQNLLNPSLDSYPLEMQHSEYFSSGLHKSSTKGSPTRVGQSGMTTDRTSRLASSRHAAVNSSRQNLNSSRQGIGTSRQTSRNTARQTSRATGRPGLTTQTSTATLENKESFCGTFVAPVPTIPPTPANVDTEARRIHLKEYLLWYEGRDISKKIEDSDKAEDTLETKQFIPPLSLLDKPKVSISKKSKKEAAVVVQPKGQAPWDKVPFVLTQYSLDFGNVVAGAHRQKKFSITNTGQIPISFKLDKNTAASMGFTVEPERVVRLPEGERIGFKVVFQARRHMKFGKIRSNLQIDVKNGPPIIVSCKANITIPEIELSSEHIDFGSVLVGRCQSFCIQLHNLSPVVADWSFKKPIGSVKDLSFFQLESSGSVLQPNEKMNISVEFVPKEGRNYNLQLPIKVVSNPKTYTLSLKGEGKEYHVQFVPSLVEIGPVLPHDEPKPAEFVIQNNSDHPVEIYSLDFDEKYKLEEDMIREAAGFGVDDVLRLPIRQVGEELPQDIQEQYYENHPPSEPTDADEAQGSVTPTPRSARSVAVESEVADGTEIDELDIPSKPTRDGVTDYVLLGAPCSGVSTQAQLLANEENLKIWDVDLAIESVARLTSQLGSDMRTALGLPQLGIDISSTSEGDTQEDALAVDKAQVKPTGLDAILLSRTMDWILNLPEYFSGSVLDNLTSKYAMPAMIIESLAAVVKHVIFLSISLSASAYEIQLENAKSSEDSVIKRIELEECVHDESINVDNPDNAQTTDNERDAAEIDENTENVADNVDEETKSEGEQSIKSIEPLPLLIEKPCPSPMDKIKLIEKAMTFESFEKFAAEYSSIIDTIHSNFVRKPTKSPKDTPDASEFVVDDKSQYESDDDDGNESVPEKEINTVEAPLEKMDDIDVKQLECHVVDVSCEDGWSSGNLHKHLLAAIEKSIKEYTNSILMIKEPTSFQLVKRPLRRFERRTVKNFVVNLENQPAAKLRTARWIVPARESCTVSVLFKSNKVGTFDSSLGFEIVGGNREYSVLCHGRCCVPSVNNDPRNIFMSRIKSKPPHGIVRKKFILSSGQYEFGPLIIGKSPSIMQAGPKDAAFEKARKINSETFRISNNGRYVAQVQFFIPKQQEVVFFVEPPTLEMAEGDTKEVKVWAFPQVEKLFESQIICCIQDNPEPLKFMLSCLGAQPSIKLNGPWDEVMDSETPVDKKAKIDSTLTIDYDRLLLGRQDEKTFSVHNTSSISIDWRLDTSNFPAEFHASCESGTLKPDDKVCLELLFNAMEEKTFDFKSKIEYTDSESGFQEDRATKNVPLKIIGESYRIDVSLFETADGKKASGILDFGLKRVGESSEQQLYLRNNGKYDIKYSIDVKRGQTKQYFTIAPMMGEIKPGMTSSISVIFNSSQEVHLKNNSDIKCNIMEKITSELHNEFSVIANVRSVYSQFRLQPQRGLSFGALKFNEETKLKRFEIRNDGEFPFKFKFFKESDKLPATFTIASDVSASPLNIGRFVITPSGGSIDPGSLIPLEVKFTPENEKNYLEKVRIEISGRDPNNLQESESLIYELLGESCYPGIATVDYESIFEEQAVVRTVNASSSQSQNVFIQQENKFSFGAVLCSAGQKGASERFKIINPTKVLTSVKFTLKQSDKEESCPFDVSPEEWLISPHESRYVTVIFKPLEMKTYNAVFSASVTDGANPKTNKLEFDLVGMGTMPCITIEKPNKRDTEGSLLLDFGNVRLNRKKKLPIVVRNDGIIPSTVLFAMGANKSFSFSGRNGSITLAAMTSETLWVQYLPKEAAKDGNKCTLKLNVQHNPYDESIINILGQSVMEYITFDDLPNEAEEQLQFSDLDLNTSDSTQEYFTLKNHSDTRVKFKWTNIKGFQFSPSEGHIPPKSTKDICATFSASAGESLTLVDEPVQLSVQKIKVISDENGEMNNNLAWDNTVSTVEFDENSGENKSKGVPETITEPEHEAIEDASMLTLKCSAAADTAKFTCSTNNIAFKQTFMFQSCVFEFSIQNKATIALPYSWSWQPASTGRPLSARSIKQAPFTVTPESGNILPDDQQTFQVRFSPIEVDDFLYVLNCDMSLRIPEETEKISLNVSGKSKRPVCHIDVEESNYAQRRKADLPGPQGELGPLDPAVRVIEMESLGLKVRNTRRFYVINPTNVSYEFSWQQVGASNSMFRCATSKGLMLAGKKCEMAFEFTPQSVELQESFWSYRIPQFNIDQTFLFVGTTTEPSVTLDRNYINFNTLLTGSKARNTVNLINKEHIPFNFSFDRSTFDFSALTGEKSALQLSPLSGVIPANGQATIEIDFAPLEEKEYNFNLVCVVKRKPTKLALNIKGEGYAIHDLLTVAEDSMANSSSAQQLQLSHQNYIDFGVVRVNERESKNVIISNTGKMNFEYLWEPSKHNPMLVVTPVQGTVRKNDRAICKLEFHPVQETVLDNLQYTCTIAGTRKYTVGIAGSAVPPAVHFSFSAFDFGPSFIAAPGAPPISSTSILRVTNQDGESDFSIDCLHEKTSFLRVDFHPKVLSPGETIEVPIVFTARQEIAYNEIVPFSVNSSTIVNIHIQGEGIVPRLELSSLAFQQVDFGSLQIGQNVSRVVKLTNKSKRSSMFQLVDRKCDRGYALNLNCVHFSPSHEVQIKPRETVPIEIRFTPLNRIRPFKEELRILSEGTESKLLVVSGACHGMEVELEADTLPFGPVCFGSQLIRKLQIMNYGDLLAKFRWDASKFRPDFSISPAEGILPPGMDKKFDVTFKPTALNDDLRYEKIPLFIEGMENLCITLTGCCTSQPASSIKELFFESKVRVPLIKQVSVDNPTTIPWNLIPVIQGDHWSSKETLQVPAKGKAVLDITYCPLTMTTSSAQSGEKNKEDNHTGSVFFALPDGSAILHNFIGVAGLPSANDTLTLTTAAKKALPIKLPLKNWLNQSQRFTVNIQSSENDKSTFIDGTSTIDLPPTASRDYSLKFFAYLQGKTSFRVTFCNESTGEFMFFEIVVTITAPGVVNTLHFDAPIRQAVKKIVTIENPFPKEFEINFLEDDKWWKCDNVDIRVRRLSELTGHCEGSFEVEYRPLVYSAEQPLHVRLVISCIELGDYIYDMDLCSTKAGAEKILYFNVALGGFQSQTYRFMSYARGAAIDYNCSVQQSSFFGVASVAKVEKSDSWDGVECGVVIKFEPEALGEIRDTLTITSPIGGEYKVSLHGVSTPPLPQGPFVFKSSFDLPFKNVLNESREFLFTSDNPKFTIAPKSQTIAPKSSKSVSIKPTENIVTTGKVLVTCPTLPDMPPWVFYLESNPHF